MTNLLVKVRGDGKAFFAAAGKAFGAAKLDAVPILSVPAQPTGQGIAVAHGATWLRVSAPSGEENPWDRAHAILSAGAPFAIGGSAGIQAVEPDIQQEWPPRPPSAENRAAAAASMADFCKFEGQDQEGTKAAGQGPAWHLGDAFSQLTKARAKVGAKQGNILIAHLDTGYDPEHVTRPVNLRQELERNFVDEGFPQSAVDRVPPGKELIRNHGHGTGTLSLLAGNTIGPNAPGFGQFHDFLGGAPQAQIMPVRIADWVVRFSTSTIVQGLEHARRNGAHVLSMSMGGYTSDALVDAINLAYDSGVVMVTAAGNNFAWVPSPKSIVFPARYKRVLAACGVMADGRAYADLSVGTMQGNYGPSEKMSTALGAYTPNVPWAQIGCGNIVDMNGAGTSSATPQIAAAAALWLAEHWDTVKNYPEPWMRVEAVRHALFSRRRNRRRAWDRRKPLEKIGQGVMRAFDALSVSPPRPSNALTKLLPAQPSWPWIT